MINVPWRPQESTGVRVTVPIVYPKGLRFTLAVFRISGKWCTTARASNVTIWAPWVFRTRFPQSMYPARGNAVPTMLILLWKPSTKYFPARIQRVQLGPAWARAGSTSATHITCMEKNILPAKRNVRDSQRQEIHVHGDNEGGP